MKKYFDLKWPQGNPRGPLSPSEQLRRATGIVAMTLLNTADRDRSETRAEVLEAAKAALRDGPASACEEYMNIPGQPEPELVVDMEGVFRMVAHHGWRPMDDRKAERFYAVVEGCVDGWLDDPSLLQTDGARAAAGEIRLVVGKSPGGVG